MQEENISIYYVRCLYQRSVHSGMLNYIVWFLKYIDESYQRNEFISDVTYFETSSVFLIFH
jgi:hypothetical protein